MPSLISLEVIAPSAISSSMMPLSLNLALLISASMILALVKLLLASFIASIELSAKRLSVIVAVENLVVD